MCTESEEWQRARTASPFNLTPNEPDAPAVALNVFEIVNNFAVRDVVIVGKNCDIAIVFENVVD